MCRRIPYRFCNYGRKTPCKTPGGVCIRIKICGITSPDDAELVEKAGADAIGVVLFSASPRCVTVDMARDIFDAVPALMRVGVSHSYNPEELQEICAIRPDALQISSMAPAPRECRASIIRMVGTTDQVLPDADALIVDGSHGTGRLFDYAFASRVIETAGMPVFLAGGLTPDNVASAVLAVRPYGVDVATGVEYAPGKKDPSKVRAFIAAARGGII
jgi:phosphoribosylanthranilate isomerase